MIVADTTLVTYFLIDGQFTAEAERVRAKDANWVAPRLLRSELLNVLSSYVRFRDMDRDLAIKFFRRGISMVDMTEADPDPVEVLNISQAGPCTGYDAEFVWLAQTPKRPPLDHRRRTSGRVPGCRGASFSIRLTRPRMPDPLATNLTWHAGTVTRQDRERLIGQKGVTVWLTGLSAAGKSTIAVLLERMLLERRKLAYRLDGDNVRHGLNKNLGFGQGDRAENIRRIGEVCKLFTDAGVIVIASFISPYRRDRDAVRANLGRAGSSRSM